MANLIEGLHAEMDRCRELVKRYEEIGPAGAFGKAVIEQSIREAKKAIETGDAVAMVGLLKRMKEHK